MNEQVGVFNGGCRAKNPSEKKEDASDWTWLSSGEESSSTRGGGQRGGNKTVSSRREEGLARPTN